VVGAVVAAGFGAGVGDDGEVEALWRWPGPGEEAGALGSVDVDLLRDADGQEHVVVDVEGDLGGGDGRVLAEVFGAEQALFFGGDGGEDYGVGQAWMPDWDQARASSRIMPTPVALSAAPL
jgi:hypothetical protein